MKVMTFFLFLTETEVTYTVNGSSEQKQSHVMKPPENSWPDKNINV